MHPDNISRPVSSIHEIAEIAQTKIVATAPLLCYAIVAPRTWNRDKNVKEPSMLGKSMNRESFVHSFVK